MRKKKLVYEKLGLPEKKNIAPIKDTHETYKVETINFEYDSEGKLVSKKSTKNHSILTESIMS